MNLRQIRRGLAALALVLLPSLALADDVPLKVYAKWFDPPGETLARLNQDGSWTIEGDLARRLENGVSIGADYDCLVATLQRENVISNPSPDNSAPMSFARTMQVICADKVVQSCRREFNLTCEEMVSQR